MHVPMNVFRVTMHLTLMHGHMRQQAMLIFRCAKNLAEILLIHGERIMIMVAEHELLIAVERCEHVVSILAEEYIAQMPHRIALRDRRVPARDQFPIMLLDRCERARRLLELNDLLVPEVRVGDDEDFTHSVISTSGCYTDHPSLHRCTPRREIYPSDNQHARRALLQMPVPAFYVQTRRPSDLPACSRSRTPILGVGSS